MRIHDEQIGNVTVTAIAKLERLESGIEPALLLIQGTEKKQDNGLGFILGQIWIGDKVAKDLFLRCTCAVGFSLSRLCFVSTHKAWLNSAAL
jgi:hypothetical protein